MVVWLNVCAVLSLVAGMQDSPAHSPPGRFGHVEKMGTGDTTLILVPCLGCDWHSWDEFMERNKNRYTMYAVTWPGMGDTRMPDIAAKENETPLWNNVMTAMEHLIKSEALNDPILVGHSAAGPFVVHFADKYPGLVGGIVTVDGTITDWETYNFTRDERNEWAKNEMVRVREKYGSDEKWTSFNAPPKSLSDENRRALYGRMWKLPKREDVFRYWREWLMTDVGVMLPRMKVPALAMYALRPNHPELASARIQRLARFNRNDAASTIQIVFVHPSGHMVWEHQPRVFDRMIAEFVAGEENISSYWGN